ncbi:MAG TPA: hypothetical protein VGX96_19175 [Candidatus Elarobacter sp.]|jgi:hypothetical protein|nr:hypothetical protein [Candidatus Elarobacter sp.]
MVKMVRISSPRPSTKVGRYEVVITRTGEEPVRLMGASSSELARSASAVVMHSDENACDLRTALRAVVGSL